MMVGPVVRRDQIFLLHANLQDLCDFVGPLNRTVLGLGVARRHCAPG